MEHTWIGGVRIVGYLQLFLEIGKWSYCSVAWGLCRLRGLSFFGTPQWDDIHLENWRRGWDESLSEMC